jgi:hypothetical protein
MTDKEKVKLYEEDGIVGAYYALNRKLNEITSLLNNSDLSRLDLSDRNDGSWERVLKLFGSVGEINDVMKKLKIDNQLSGDEEKDKMRKKPIIEELFMNDTNKHQQR